ncbi:MAG: MFS transporter, partial [Actinobacteria bacterium]|nr:MFS transporter [Actinomycetota bacterium]
KPAGKYSAKFGSQPIIFFSTIALAISYLLLGFLFSLTWFWITLFIFGFVIATQDVAMNAHAVVVEQRAGRRLMSVFHAMFSLGTLFGGILGGVFSQFEITPLIQASLLALLYILAAFLVRPMLLPASADTHHFGGEKRAKHPFIYLHLSLPFLILSSAQR